MVSPGWMSGVSAWDSAPFCQQSPDGANGVGVMVFTENGVKELPIPENVPITTGEPVTASGRVAVTVVCPNEGKLVATTESPETTIVGDPALAAAGELCATAGAQTAAEPISARAGGTSHRRVFPAREARRDFPAMNDSPFVGKSTAPIWRGRERNLVRCAGKRCWTTV
jgi:hypothetical protein